MRALIVAFMLLPAIASAQLNVSISTFDAGVPEDY